MREAANAVAQSVANSGQSATQQVSTSIEIWKYLFGTAFPVHLLDKENSKLSNPIANAQDANSSSGGYAAGDRPDSLGTTGGSGIAEQAPSGYSRPEEKLPASEVMYQDSGDCAKTTLPVMTDLGKVSFDAANGVGTIYSPKVKMKASKVICDDFAVERSSVSTQHLHQEHTLREFRMYISELKTL